MLEVEHLTQLSFTMDESMSYVDKRDSFTICLPEVYRTDVAKRMGGHY